MKLRRISDSPNLRAVQKAAARLERELERQGEKREVRRRLYDAEMVLACYQNARARRT